VNGDRSPASPAFVDTNILIDVGRRVADAIACIEQIEEHGIPGISVVVQMELLIGCRDRAEMRAVERLFRRFQIAPLTEQISAQTVDLLRRYRLSHGLQIADALIAATALVHDRPLVTQNQRDFHFIQGLRLLPYPNPFRSS